MEGGHRTRLRNDLNDQLVCLGVPPAPVYKGARGGGRPALLARQGGVFLLVGVGLLLGGGKKWGGRRKGGRRPPSPSPIGTRGRRHATHLWLPLSLSTKAHMAHYSSRGGSGNPPALRFSPKSPGTLPVSEYSHPIYQSLCLDHFETPRHVRDHIRDSELTLVHQNS